MVRWRHRLNNMSLGKLQELVMDREARHAAVHGVGKTQTWLSDRTELNWRDKMSLPVSLLTSQNKSICARSGLGLCGWYHFILLKGKGSFGFLFRSEKFYISSVSLVYFPQCHMIIITRWHLWWSHCVPSMDCRMWVSPCWRHLEILSGNNSPPTHSAHFPSLLVPRLFTALSNIIQSIAIY